MKNKAVSLSRALLFNRVGVLLFGAEICFEPHKFEVRTFVNREIKKMFEKNGFRMM